MGGGGGMGGLCFSIDFYAVKAKKWTAIVGCVVLSGSWLYRMAQKWIALLQVVVAKVHTTNWHGQVSAFKSLQPGVAITDVIDVQRYMIGQVMTICQNITKHIDAR